MPFKILIVDDEPDLEMLVTQKFRSRIREGDIAFVFVSNGLNALEKLGTDPEIDLVLSDINMPQMDGLTLLSKIKENNFTQKTVVISAYGDMNNIRLAMNRGAFDFVVKPIDFSDFEITLNKAIAETIYLKEANQTKIHLDNERKEKEELILNQNKMLEQKVDERTRELKEEKQKSEDLLHNILPVEVANELKLKGTAEARHYNNVTVLFTDFVNFTGISEQMSPTELVQEIHKNFTAFDAIMENHGIEKIKTIGDAYLAVCGLPNETVNHAQRVAQAALDLQRYITENNSKFRLRIGIHSGPVVAGIVGMKKFAYDIWGDTVNTAARMEQNSEAGKINISGATYELVKDHFDCVYRGKIDAKNKGMVDMYFVNRSLGEG